MTRRLISLGGLAASVVAAMAVMSGVAQAAPSTTSASRASATAAHSTRTALGPVKYHITVHTGDVSNAGTDSDVYLKLYGTGGVSPSLPLDNSEDNFERNKYDYFDRWANDLGTLTYACVRFDDLGGFYSGWYLDWITVNGRFFQYYRWFEHDTTDCRRAV